MGNTLAEPVLDIHGETGTFQINGKSKHSFALSHMQGWRPTMEDTHICLPSLPSNAELNFPEIKEIALFGVFDGHGGVLSSQYCQEHFVSTMQSSLFYPQLTKNLAENGSEAERIDILKKLVQDTVCLLDNQLRVIHEEKNVRNGTTAVFAFLTEESIICCNIGDSRGLLCKGNGMTSLGLEFYATKDHKPADLLEKARIQAAGLKVINNRICYDLAISRAFGDFAYKNVSRLSAFDQPVSIFCDIYVWPRDGSELFLCLACDGIWDVLSNGQLVNFVLSSIKENKTLKETTDSITKQCLESQDNMSIILVAFDKLGLDTSQRNETA